mmetsp:Transcript_33258/g.83344  ORF Transcript_33258/g.83344 Transcript_33258/m.83344 type:complete len:289 (+) Transcript_33258:17-883(+)
MWTTQRYRDHRARSDLQHRLKGMGVMNARMGPQGRQEDQGAHCRDGLSAVNQLLRSAVAEACAEQMPTGAVHFIHTPAMIASYACYSCCVITLLSIASIVYAVSGPGAMVYYLCVATLATHPLGTIIPTIPLLSYMAKLVYTIPSAGVRNKPSLEIARRKMGFASGTVPTSALFGLTTGVMGLIVSGMMAIAKEGCHPMCNVIWLIGAVLAVAMPVVLAQLQSSVNNKVLDEEVSGGEDGDIKQFASATVMCCSFCAMWALALIVGLISALHQDMQCANPDFIWEPDT